jgi:hypothetical protein
VEGSRTRNTRTRTRKRTKERVILEICRVEDYIQGRSSHLVRQSVNISRFIEIIAISYFLLSRFPRSQVLMILCWHDKGDVEMQKSEETHK